MKMLMSPFILFFFIKSRHEIQLHYYKDATKLLKRGAIFVQRGQLIKYLWFSKPCSSLLTTISNKTHYYGDGSQGEAPPSMISSAVAQCLCSKCLQMVSSQHREAEALFQGRRGESVAVSMQTEKLGSDLLQSDFRHDLKHVSIRLIQCPSFSTLPPES